MHNYTYIVQVRDVQKELRVGVGNANIVYYKDKKEFTVTPVNQNFMY